MSSEMWQVCCKSLGLPEKSILRKLGDRANAYTDKHRASYEWHSDTIDEHQENEESFRNQFIKLGYQEPGHLIEEDRIQPLYAVGLCVSCLMLGSSFFATVIATSTQVQQHSEAGSWFYAISLGLIAAFGGALLKWATHYPFAPYRRELEILFVPIVFGFFGLFIYQITDLYFYIQPVLLEASPPPDFSQFVNNPGVVETQIETTEMVSLKWLYVGILGTEMFASYAFMSFIGTCSTWQLKPVVRAIRLFEEKLGTARHINRVKIRKSRKQSSWLQYLAKRSEVPGRIIHEILTRLSK